MKQRYPFENLHLSKDEALDMFSYSKFKSHLIQEKVKEDEMTSVYRIGDFVDLCTGPHIPTTGQAKVMSLVKNSSAYWLGNSENESLQRIYGVSFRDKNQMKEYKRMIEEAKKRDHRLIG